MPKMSKEDFNKIETACEIKDTEEYSVVWHKVKGQWLRSIHVFERQPMTSELTKYEDIVSKVKVKGQKVTMEGSQVSGAKYLYDLLVQRVYDLPLGRKVIPQLNGSDAAKTVLPLVKREAIRDFIGEVYSDARMNDIEGDEEDADAKEGD